MNEALSNLKSQKFRSFNIIGMDIECVSSLASYQAWNEAKKQFIYDYYPTNAKFPVKFARWWTIATPYGLVVVIDCAKTSKTMFENLHLFLFNSKTVVSMFDAYEDLWSLHLTFGPIIPAIESFSKYYQKVWEKGVFGKLRVFDLKHIIDLVKLSVSSILNQAHLANAGLVYVGRGLWDLGASALHVDLAEFEWKIDKTQWCHYWNVPDIPDDRMNYVVLDPLVTIHSFMAFLRLEIVPKAKPLICGFPSAYCNPDQIDKWVSESIESPVRFYISDIKAVSEELLKMPMNPGKHYRFSLPGFVVDESNPPAPETQKLEGIIPLFSDYHTRKSKSQKNKDQLNLNPEIVHPENVNPEISEIMKNFRFKAIRVECNSWATIDFGYEFFDYENLCYNPNPLVGMTPLSNSIKSNDELLSQHMKLMKLNESNVIKNDSVMCVSDPAPSFPKPTPTPPAPVNCWPSLSIPQIPVQYLQYPQQLPQFGTVPESLYTNLEERLLLATEEKEYYKRAAEDLARENAELKLKLEKLEKEQEETSKLKSIESKSQNSAHATESQHQKMEIFQIVRATNFSRGDV